MDLSPITFEYELACGADEAFATYTERIGDWWHPDYTANADTFDSVTIEPGVGGRIVERHSDGGEVGWGEVRAWEPGTRLVHTFALAQDPAHPSEVRAEFEPHGESRCTLRFAQGGWNEANAENRKKFGDWPVLLGRFQDLCSAR
jgi:uncharacterized protein YndB with AHSA1/START domain